MSQFEIETRETLMEMDHEEVVNKYLETKGLLHKVVEENEVNINVAIKYSEKIAELTAQVTQLEKQKCKCGDDPFGKKKQIMGYPLHIGKKY